MPVANVLWFYFLRLFLKVKKKSFLIVYQYLDQKFWIKRENDFYDLGKMCEVSRGGGSAICTTYRAKLQYSK